MPRVRGAGVGQFPPRRGRRDPDPDPDTDADPNPNPDTDSDADPGRPAVGFV